jgi:hypothetical protein
MTDVDLENVVKNAVYARLISDTTLTNMLATYTDSGGTVTPALFMNAPVPPKAARPWVVLAGFTMGDNFDTKDRPGFEVESDILSVADVDGTSRVVAPIAYRVWSLLHKFYLDVSGFQNLISKAGPPIVAPTDETLIGRTIHARWIFRALP